MTLLIPARADLIPDDLHQLFCAYGQVVKNQTILIRDTRHVRRLFASMLRYEPNLRAVGFPQSLQNEGLWQRFIADLTGRRDRHTTLLKTRAALHALLPETNLFAMDAIIRGVIAALPPEPKIARQRLSVAVKDMPEPFRALLRPFVSDPITYKHLVGDLGRFCGVLERNNIAWRRMEISALDCPMHWDLLAEDLYDDDDPKKTIQRFGQARTSLRRLGILAPLPKDWRRHTPARLLQDDLLDSDGRALSPDALVEAAISTAKTSAALPYADQKMRELRRLYDPDYVEHDAKVDYETIGDALFDDLVNFDKALLQHPFHAKKQGLNVCQRDSSLDSMRYALIDWHHCLATKAPLLNKTALAGEAFLAAMEAYRSYLGDRGMNPSSIATYMFRVSDALAFVRGHILEEQLIKYQAAHMRKAHAPEPVVPDLTQQALRQLGKNICETARHRINDLRQVRHRYIELRNLGRRYRDGLILSLLSYFPLRLSSLKQLEVGTSVKTVEAGWAISLEAYQHKTGAKTGEGIFEVLKPALCSLIDDYLDERDGELSIRQLIAPGSASKAMWLSGKGEEASVWIFKNMIPEYTMQGDGTYISCHDVRRIIATLLYATDPELAKRYLTHRSKRMTKIYVAKDQQQAPRNVAAFFHGLAKDILA